jgi:hypothetical protein
MLIKCVSKGTIRNADLIYCLKNGQIIECGTHSELMNSNGHYYSLVKSQENSTLIDEEKNKAHNNKAKGYEDSKLGNFY